MEITGVFKKLAAPELAVLELVLTSVTATAPAWVRESPHAFVAIDETWAVPGGEHARFAAHGKVWRVAPSALAADTASLIVELPRRDGRYRMRAVAEVLLPPRRSLEVLEGCSTDEVLAVVRAWQTARGSLGHDVGASLGLVRAVLDV